LDQLGLQEAWLPWGRSDISPGSAWQKKAFSRGGMQLLPVDAHVSDPEANSAPDVAEEPPKRQRIWPKQSVAAFFAVALAVLVFVLWCRGSVSGNGKAEEAVSLDLVREGDNVVHTFSAKAATTTNISRFTGEAAIIRLRDPSQCMELFDADPSQTKGGKTVRAHRCPGERCSYDTCMSFTFTGTGQIRVGEYCLDAPRLQYQLQFWPCASIRDARHMKFSVEDDGRVRLMADPTRCVSVFDESARTRVVVNGHSWREGPLLELRDCGGAAMDKWSLHGPSGYVAGAKLE